jgi:hypothetical protein
MRTVVMAAFGFVVMGSTLACGGVMSQAATQNLVDARLTVNGCTGDGQPSMLAASDGAISAAGMGVFSFTEMVELQVEIDQVTADSEISTPEAEAFALTLESLAAR